MAKKADDKKKLVEQIVSAIEKTDKGEAIKEASKQFNKLMAVGGELSDEFFENKENKELSNAYLTSNLNFYIDNYDFSKSINSRLNFIVTKYNTKQTTT